MFAYVDGPFSFGQVLLLSFGMGLLGGIWYECLRIVRTAVKTIYAPQNKVGRIFLCSLDFGLDMTFFLVLSVATVLFLFVCNRGQLRLSMLVSAGMGLYVYFVTLGRVILRLHTAILRLVYRLFCYVYRYTLGYLWGFVKWLYQGTLGIVVCRIQLWLKERFHDFLCGRAKRRLERLVTVFEKSFAEFDDYISID